MSRVSGRVWCTKKEQWKTLGFETMEDAEEWMTDTGETLEGIREYDRTAD